MILKEISSISYENGKRVAMQKVTYDKSDDLFTLADMQRQLEALIRQREANEANGKSSSRLQEEIDKLTSDIAFQQNIIDGYNDISTENTTDETEELIK